LCKDVHAHRTDHGAAPNPETSRAGRQINVPPSFVGRPRYMHAHFQDAMAIVREFHKPDLFITFTCNPKWPEVLGSLLPGQQSSDHPDIVARVFNRKVKQFLSELNKDSIMGKRDGNLHVIEQQKRGLPHSHHLHILCPEDRLHTAAQVDNVISAELPPDPKDFAEGSDKREQAQRLEDTVVRNMIHKCSSNCRPNNESCKKGFPKLFQAVTEWNETDFYPKYRRRSKEQGGREYTMPNGDVIDNRWVVPYSPYLVLAYDAHINVEVCVSPTAAKYLFTYIHKGQDRSM
ncbi:MAG: hypothetical protein GY696_35220, partial [Gammaproteobacteria bacterium]|nr:hypothetical protein [Gammaproteobacteria bacterium]